MQPVVAKEGETRSSANPFVGGREGAPSNLSVFHSDGWGKVLEQTYGHTRFLFPEAGASSGGAFLPVMEVRSRLTGCRGVSMPFSDACPIPGDDAEARQELFEAAVEMGTRRGWRYLEIRGESGLFSARPASERYYGHELKLSPDVGKLFEGVDSSVRRAIRKAERSGVRVEFSTELEAVRSYYELHCRTRRRQGVPPQSWRFFENIQKEMLGRELGCVALARSGGRAVAGAVFFQLKPNVLYKFGASDERYQSLRPNNLVMWRALERYALEGYEGFQFGRTASGHESLRRFKMGWGAREYSIKYYRWDCRSGKFMAAKKEHRVKSFEAFRWLPISFFKLTGNLLYRHLH